MIRNILAALLLGAAFTPVAHGAVLTDPDWPCIQRRQPALSVGQIWGGPPPDDEAEARKADADVQHLGRVIALRRTSMQQAESLIAEFAETHDGASQIALFLVAFDHIQSQRNRVMAGITRYARQQDTLDDRINDKRHEFAQLMAADSPDYDAIDRVEEEIDWSTRIFQDRQQSLTHVCETSVILEQRAFALGRAILSHMPR